MLAAQAAYQQMSFHEAVEAVVLLCSKGNLFLDEVKPWAALKNVSASGGGAVSLYKAALYKGRTTQHMGISSALAISMLQL